MDVASASFQRRLAIAARTPGLGAAQLLALEALAPDLGVLARPDPAALAGLGLTTEAVAWLTAPDEALVASDLHWLAASGTVLLPASSAPENSPRPGDASTLALSSASPCEAMFRSTRLSRPQTIRAVLLA